MRFNILGLRCAVKHHLPQAEHLLRHAYSCDCHQGFMEASEVCRCCAPLAQARLFAVVCECKDLQVLGWGLWHLGVLWHSCVEQCLNDT